MSLPNASSESNFTLVAATNQTLFGNDATRRRISIGNNGANQANVTFNGAAATATQGMPIPAGGTLMFSYDDHPGIVIGAINAISTVGTTLTVLLSNIAE